MADLFAIDRSGIHRHLNNIYKEEELNRDTTNKKITVAVNRGVRGEVQEEVEFYNLDAIIAVGYRINSRRATQFRIWATQILIEYISIVNISK